MYVYMYLYTAGHENQWWKKQDGLGSVNTKQNTKIYMTDRGVAEGESLMCPVIPGSPPRSYEDGPRRLLTVHS